MYVRWALQVFVNGQSTSYVCKVGIASICEWPEYKLCMLGLGIASIYEWPEYKLCM